MSNFGHFRALETPGGELGFHGSISGSKTGRKSTFWTQFGDGCWTLLGSVSRYFWGRRLDHVFDDFGMVQAPFWGRVRHIVDTKSEPAQNHENNIFCCYLLYFRHVPDPEHDAISEQFHVFVVVFFEALFWDRHFSDFGDFWCPLEVLSGHV